MATWGPRPPLKRQTRYHVVSLRGLPHPTSKTPPVPRETICATQGRADQWGGGITGPTHPEFGKPRDPALSHPHRRGGGGGVGQPPTHAPTHPPKLSFSNLLGSWQSWSLFDETTKRPVRVLKQQREICARQTSNAPVELSQGQPHRAHTHKVFSYCAWKWRPQQTVGKRESPPGIPETSHPHGTGGGCLDTHPPRMSKTLPPSCRQTAKHISGATAEAAAPLQEHAPQRAGKCWDPVRP